MGDDYGMPADPMPQPPMDQAYILTKNVEMAERQAERLDSFNDAQVQWLCARAALSNSVALAITALAVMAVSAFLGIGVWLIFRG